MHPDDYAEDALAMANRAIAMGDDTDGGFTDDEEAEQLAHVRAAAKRSAEIARSITESLSPAEAAAGEPARRLAGRLARLA